jgi:phosphoribosyl-ATP pyrophosphohydrolase/phosphoribosyl-AMP cyclohydrolase/histidinol dehydrogenase
MLAALDGISTADRDVLERTADRIRAFAQSQRSTLGDLDVAVPGGRAGHTVVPVVRAGCYAPGGRFPLPSSVLMTAVTARVAGVPEVIVASPRPAKATLAAAAVAGADILLAAGGAHAIAAMAYGAGPVPPCDAIVGPGNRWVTAAKQLVSGPVVIDMLAGPSELVVLADGTADPDVVAADLIAQAEHDPDALPILVTTAGETFACAVDDAIARRLVDLPTAATAIPALQNGFTVLAPDLDAAIAVCDRLAPEHLEVKTLDPKAVAARLRHYGALFVGSASAEVFGDYGAGPNHVLPTGGTARSMGGLSVLTFLRVRTWLCLDDAAPLLDDAARLARMEGLEGHARAAEARKVIREPVPGFSHATAALKESK